MPENGQSYYPSWKIKLSLRIDEFGDFRVLKEPPKQLAHNLEGPPPTRDVTLEAIANSSGGGFTVVNKDTVVHGLVTPGNIDLANRPVVHNEDGSISTVRSLGVNIGGKEILIPTVAADGSGILSDANAIKQYNSTGQHLGIFKTAADSDRYAQQLHLAQESAYTAPKPGEPKPGDDKLSHDVTLVPPEIDWNQNGVRTADTLTTSFRWIDCPIDPRCVRSCAIEVFIGTVTADEYAAGVRGERGPDGELKSLLQETYLDENNKQRSNSRFKGWVDKWEVTFSEDDEPMVKLECKDNTTLLIVQQHPPRLTVSAKLPIDRAVADLLAEFPQMEGMTVQYLPKDAKVPVIADITSNTALVKELGPPPSKGGGANGKQSVLDYLMDVCWKIGHTIRITGTTVIIQNMASFTTSAITKRDDDPFVGRTIDGQLFGYRTFIYGHNLTEMSIARNYAKREPKNVEVKSYNNEKKTLYVGRYPPNNPKDANKGRVPHARPGNSTPEQKFEIFRIPGLTSEADAKAYAQSIFESFSRNEFEVHLKTHNFASLGGDNMDPDILDMQPGDTFELLQRSRDNEINTINSIERQMLSAPRAAAFLKHLGFSDDFADAYARAYTDAGFLTQFRMKSMKVHCTVTDGVEFSIEGINYVEVRNDKTDAVKAANDAAAKTESINNVPQKAPLPKPQTPSLPLAQELPLDGGVSSG